MKTTIELADDLAQRARLLAQRRGVTLRTIIEDAIRLSLAEEDRRGQYTLPDKSVDGNGLQTEFRGKSWSDIREAAYEGKYN